MKNIYKLILAGLVFLPVSCSDFLTELPTTSVVADAAYSSTSTVEADVLGVYNSLQIFENSSLAYYLGNSSILQEWTGKRTADNWIQSYYLTQFSETSSNSSIYKALYAGVSRANSLIAGIRNSSFDDEYKTKIEGEARFLRAYFYFALTRYYGDVCLIDYVPKSLSDANVKRTPYQQVYKFILEDLDYAFENMRTKTEQDAVSTVTGRCYNYAALAVKAEVLMWMACYMQSPDDQWFDTTKEGRAPDFSDCGYKTAEEAWKASLECSEKVINDPDTPYALEPDFRNLFRWEPDEHPEDYSSKERIVVIQNTINSGGSNAMTQWTLIANPYGTLSTSGHWSNAGRMRPSRFTWQKWGEQYGGTMGGNNTFPTVYTKIPDPRIDVTYMYSKVQSYMESKNFAVTSTTVFPSYSKSGNPANSHYYRKAYSKTVNGNNGDADYYLMRMATVYLNAAEAAAELGQTSKSLGYLNKILERARNSTDGAASVEPHDYQASDFSTKEELVNAIMWERVFEQDGEGHVWFDTHRRGANWLLENLIKPYDKFGEEAIQKDLLAYMFSAMPSKTGHNQDLDIVRAGLICAFPKYEFQYNTALNEDTDRNDFFIK